MSVVKSRTTVLLGLTLVLAITLGGVSVAGTRRAPNTLSAQIRTGMTIVPAHEVGEADARCLAGEVATGGGYQQATINPSVNVFVNAPVVRNGRWRWVVEVINESDIQISLTAFAVCATA
jgi:hypothetical protein